jgi:hypothetical protein
MNQALYAHMNNKRKKKESRGLTLNEKFQRTVSHDDTLVGGSLKHVKTSGPDVSWLVQASVPAHVPSPSLCLKDS